MSLVAAAVAGGVLGARHALETDHLAAVATLVDDESGTPGLVGASWGVGHTVPIAAVGLAFLSLGIRLPEAVTRLFEVGVGVVLVVLGVRMLASVVGSYEHAHAPHPLHDHLRVGWLSVGPTHAHLHGDSLLVGALHGLAGSGALVIALVSAAPGVPTALAFLLAFGALSVATMAAVSALWGRTLDADEGAGRVLRGVAGLVGVVVGVLLVVERVGVVPL